MTRTRRKKSNRDYKIVGLVGLLALIGIIVIYTISPALSYGNAENSSNAFLYKHLSNTFIGIIGFVVASRFSLDAWRKALPWIIGASALASVLLLVPATSLTLNGATRWIGFGPFSFQPAELMKLTIILYLGFLLAGRSDEEINDKHITLYPVAILLGILGVLVVVLQRDLGTMLVLTVITVGMLFFRGINYKQLGLLFGGLTAAGVVSVLAFPHRMARFTTFLNPSSDTLGAGYHVDQALTAIGSGGLFGQGIGRSVQIYGYLPEAENDSVFAIISEIFGFIGGLSILLLLGYLIFRIVKVAEQQSTTEGRLIASGVVLWLSSHIVINVGAMVALLPLTGLTLPFLSYGGSSLLFMMTAIGLVFGLSSDENTSHAATSKYNHKSSRAGSRRQARGRSRRPKLSATNYSSSR